MELREAEIRIGDEIRFALIKVTGRTYPTRKDYWDGNWLNAEVRVSVGGFRAQVEGNLRAEEFVRFREELASLYDNLSGTASFKTMEEWLSVEISGDGRGHMIAECVAMDRPGWGNSLHFWLGFDQTYMPDMLEQLDKIIELFPIVGERPS